ncbi:MAG: steroid delta-isomerase [Acidimicrobiales bacterium]|jgi:steroid delta-isomerase|nr:steroid delta-isomerase [Acidimicrobiales bacterium]
MPTPEQLQAVVDTYTKAWANGDKAAYVGLFADGAELADPVGTPIRRGRDEIAEFWDQTFGLADSINMEVTRRHLCANQIAMVFTIHAKTGASAMAIDAVDVFEVDDDGKVTSFKAYWDEMRPE